ncbi:unnamed protein product [Phaeothamnion confervicola]
MSLRFAGRRFASSLLSGVRQRGLPLRTPVHSACLRRPLSFSFPGPRKLNEIANLPLLEKEDDIRIREIWNEYHRDQQNALGAVLKASDLANLRARAKSCPLLLVPVYRGGGYFMLISQFQDSVFLLSFLEEYKRDPSSAQPYLTISVFDDLAAKGVGLVRADIFPGLTKAESERVLRLLLRHFYLGDGFPAVENLNLHPGQFDFDTYIAACPKE